MFKNANHILLDAARMRDAIDEARARNKAHVSLYKGESEKTFSTVAPYIFQFAYGTPFANWLLRNGWGDSWGVMLKSGYPLPELQKHFRKFLKVDTEAGQSLYFRFYDPRVLRIFLPTCDTAQLREFFGPVDYFIMEDEDPAMAVRYWHENGFLKTDRQPVAELIAELPEPAPLPKKEEQLPPETAAILQELHEKYPEHIPPPNKASQQPAERKPDAQTPKQRPQPIPQPAVATVPKPENKPAPAAEEPMATPKPKTKWNMFD